MNKIGEVVYWKERHSIKSGIIEHSQTVIRTFINRYGHDVLLANIQWVIKGNDGNSYLKSEEELYLSN